MANQGYAFAMNERIAVDEATGVGRSFVTARFVVVADDGTLVQTDGGAYEMELEVPLLRTETLAQRRTALEGEMQRVWGDSRLRAEWQS